MARQFLSGFATTLAILSAAGVAKAQDEGRFAIGLQAGTPGVGVQAQVSLSDWLVLRGGYDALQWDRDDSYDGIDYATEVDFSSPGAFVDLHPFRNAFLVSVGAYFGERGVYLDATPTGPVSIGGQTFTPAQVGRLTGRIDLESKPPLLAVDFENTFTGSGHWGFRFLAGPRSATSHRSI